LGHWVIGSLGHWVIGSLGHWVIGSLGHWVIGSLGHWETLRVSTLYNANDLMTAQRNDPMTPKANASEATRDDKAHP